MTILVVHNRYRFRGGEDSVYESECAMLEKAGHRVVRYEKTNGDIRENGLFRKLALAARTIWNPATFREVAALIRAERPDVVHCHNTFPLVSPSVYWAAAREGVPVVQTLHNYRLACLNGYLFREGAVCEDCLGRAPWRGVCRGCYRASRLQSAVVAAMLLVHRALGTYRRKISLYIALTDFAKGKFVAAGLPARKISVKTNAFDGARAVERIGPPDAVGSRRFGADGAIRVIYLGRLSPEKGPDVLVAAWRILRETPGNGPEKRAELLIAGDGPEREALEKAAEGIGNVEFLGHVPKPDVEALLRSASLLVLPSRCYETFGLAVVEAAFCRTASIVPEVGSPASLVQDGVSGRFFASGDPASLADVLRDLLSDPARLRRMGDQARAAFERSDCVPDRNLAKLLEAYRSCR